MNRLQVRADDPGAMRATMKFTAHRAGTIHTSACAMRCCFCTTSDMQGVGARRALRMVVRKLHHRMGR